MLRDQPFMRHDTFLGVCQALGDGLRIPSNLFRLAIAPLLIWFPFETVTLYIGAGFLIALLYWVVPGKEPTEKAIRAEPPGAAVATNDRELPALAKAA